jgi:hypothetical protein
MRKLLTRFWFSSLSGHGVGVSAYDLSDAIFLINHNSLAMSYSPILDSYVENIDVRELDHNHVIPNMGIVSNRGVWFPKS